VQLRSKLFHWPLLLQTLGNRHKEERTAMEIFTPLSFWIQLASFFFTMSGIHADLLVIRFFLVMSYLMLFLNSVLGSPLWPIKGIPWHLC
jgi:hypothetical protein